MELDAEMRRKIVVSVVAVVLFIGVILGIGTTYASGRVLSDTGGLMLVASIVLFVFTMAGVGFYLSRR